MDGLERRAFNELVTKELLSRLLPAMRTFCGTTEDLEIPELVEQFREAAAILPASALRQFALDLGKALEK